MLGIGVWLYFICCPLQGGSILQPAHEPVVPKPVPLNFNLPLPPSRNSFLDLGLGRPMALSVGQLPDEVTGSSSALTASGTGSHRPDVILLGRPRTEVFFTSGSACVSETESCGSSDGGRGGTTSQPPGIPAAAELEELKELYKAK